MTAELSAIDIFNLLRPKIRDAEAKALTDYVSQEAVRRYEERKENFAVKIELLSVKDEIHQLDSKTENAIHNLDLKIASLETKMELRFGALETRIEQNTNKLLIWLVRRDIRRIWPYCSPYQIAVSSLAGAVQANATLILLVCKPLLIMRHVLLSVLSAALIASSANGQKIDAAPLDTLFNRLARYNKLMGSVLIAKHGKTLYGRGFGQSQVGELTGVNNTLNTVYRIGSISKMFTATMVMQLAEEKRLKLTDTLAKWFPQIPNAGKITIDQLLNHHSGIHSFTEDTAFISWQDTVAGKAAIIARLASFPPDFEPGAKGAYSNSNFVILGYIVEAVTGMPYAQVLQNRITRPLKLAHTGFGAKVIRPESGEALPYAIEEGHWTATPPSSTEVAGGAGGVVSTVGDLATFIDALMTRHFLPDASLKKMMELKDDYGRGMFKFPFYDKIAYGHNGHIDNFTSMVAFFPKDSTVVSIACNGVNYVFNDALIGVLSLYYGKPFKMPEFDKKVLLSEAQLKRVEGTYSTDMMAMEITVTATASGIMAQATGQGSFPLEPVSATEFANDEVGIHLEFSGGDAPPDKMMVLQGGSRVPFTRKK